MVGDDPLPHDLLPPGVRSWTDAQDGALGPLVLRGPNEVRVRLQVDSVGIHATVLAGTPEQSRRVLITMGFREDHVRRMLCG